MLFTRKRLLSINGCFANEKQSTLVILQHWKEKIYAFSVFAAFVLQNVQMHRSSVMFTSGYVCDSHEVYGYRQRAMVQDEAEDREERGSGSFKQIPFQSQKVFGRRSIK